MTSAVLTPDFFRMPKMSHEEFLREKVAFDRSFGFPVHSDDLHQVLLPHQRDIVRWAILGGRRAIFAKFGLGKSITSTTSTLTSPQGRPWQRRTRCRRRSRVSTPGPGDRTCGTT